MVIILFVSLFLVQNTSTASPEITRWTHKQVASCRSTRGRLPSACTRDSAGGQWSYAKGIAVSTPGIFTTEFLLPHGMELACIWECFDSNDRLKSSDVVAGHWRLLSIATIAAPTTGTAGPNGKSADSSALTSEELLDLSWEVAQTAKATPKQWSRYLTIFCISAIAIHSKRGIQPCVDSFNYAAVHRPDDECFFAEMQMRTVRAMSMRFPAEAKHYQQEVHIREHCSDANEPLTEVIDR